MMATEIATSKPKFCSECGTRLREDAHFCHWCGATIDGRPRTLAAPRKAAEAEAHPPADAAVARPSAMLRWGMPLGAGVALILLSIWSAGSRTRGSSDAPQQNVPLAAATATGLAPDISSMSPEE